MAALSPARAWVGIGAPNLLGATIQPQSLVIPSGASAIDLSQVSGVNLLVSRPDGTTATWTTSILSQSATQIVCAHPYASSDCTVTGAYQVTAQLVLPSGPTLCKTRTLLVRATQAIT